MRTKNIFKTLALAMLMPAMLLTTACSNDDDAVNNENTAKNGYTLPVTINVSRQDDGTTRATYTDNGNGTGTFAFGTGDQLFVWGEDTTDPGGAGKFAGTLTWTSGSTFSGTITTEHWTGSADDLFKQATSKHATLLPSGYKTPGFLSITGDGYNAHLGIDYTKAFALTKGAAVEQFSLEDTDGYTGSGFVLSPTNAILNFTITGLAASTEVAVVFTNTTPNPDEVISKNVTTDGLGNAKFAIAIHHTSPSSYDPGVLTLTVGGHAITINSTSQVFTAGHIYNVTRAITDLSSINANYPAQNGETLTGTLASNVKISIAHGATVILNNVTIIGTNDSKWAGITCEGDATIILSGTNTVKGFDGDYPGIQAAVGKTLIIKGTGSLTASSNGFGAGIGGGYDIACGNIEIQGGTITATGGKWAAGIGGSNENCGNITISGGTVTATGGDYAAGIGGGYDGYCSSITITSGVTSVTATKGDEAPNSIGAGVDGSCGTVSIEDPSKVTLN